MGRSRLRRLVDLLLPTPLHPQWLLGAQNMITKRIGALSAGRVLDIGCANRWVEDKLAPGSEYIGVDHLETGKLLYGARPDVFADAAALPICDASIDTVIILEVLEHMRYPQYAMREISRVLRPGGKLMLTMPFLYPIHDAPHDFQRYTLHGLVREIESAGLRVELVTPSLGSAQTAGLIVCLALSGMAVEALRRRHPSVVLVPLVIVAIAMVNVVAWLTAKLFPSWSAVTAGYTAIATKP